MYRPKDKVHIKGYFRWVEFRKNEKNSLIYPPTSKDFSGKDIIRYDVKDARGVQIAQGFTPINFAFASFFFEFDLTDSMNLGDVSVELSINEGAFTHVHKLTTQEVRIIYAPNH
jgi:hypothetical protein